MSQKTVICYGDSNTYGYDPRPPFGGRYEAESRWCDILARKTGWQVINSGENGRTTPLHSWDYSVLEDNLRHYAPVQLLTIMLGTNDILMGYTKDLDVISEHIDRLICNMQKYFPELKIVLLTPTAMDIPYPDLCQLLDQLGGEYEELARKRGIFFCDTREWKLGLAGDGVHFSEEGHWTFAEKFIEFLKKTELLRG